MSNTQGANLPPLKPSETGLSRSGDPTSQDLKFLGKQVANALTLMSRVLKGAKDPDGELVKLWTIALNDKGVKPEEVEFAVRRSLSSFVFMPTPVEFAGVVMMIREETRFADLHIDAVLALPEIPFDPETHEQDLRDRGLDRESRDRLLSGSRFAQAVKDARGAMVAFRRRMVVSNTGSEVEK